MSLLEVKDLCRTFWQGDTAIHAVDHVNFSLNKGEMLAIVGQSGREDPPAEPAGRR